jgi:hypothetical protein
MTNTPDTGPDVPEHRSAQPSESPVRPPRDRAVQLLTDRYADETLGEVEFERRLALHKVASTPAEFDSLVADLEVPAPGRFPDRLPVSSTPMALAEIPDEAGSMFALMSESRRRGPWVVPRNFEVRAIMSDVKIDLREAVVAPGTTINVTAVMAAVKIVVPPEMSVVFEASAFMGSAVSRATPGDPYVLNERTIRVTGFAMMAEVKVVVRAPSTKYA